ncbi:MAG TPA: transposase [bacterium]|nr:transposase [bacterium]
MIFLDESGFSQKPAIRRTWGPRGQTPELIHNFNWKRLSAIGVLVCTPGGRSVRLRLRFQEGSVKSPDLVNFLMALRREFPRPVTLLWDRLPAHKSGPTLDYLNQVYEEGWLGLEWLPPYAPELNPVEYVWGHLDGGVMANYAPPTLAEIRQRLHKGAHQIYPRHDLLKSFLKASGLFF